MNPTENLAIILALIIVGFGYIRYYIQTRTNSLKEQLDGRLTQLLSKTEELARSQGLAEGIAGERASQELQHDH